MDSILYIVLGVIGFFIFMQLIMRFMSLAKKGKMVAGITGELGNKIKSGQKLLVYFFSPSCGACRPVTPIIDKLKNEKNNVYKINVLQQPDISRNFGVMGTPATVVVENEIIKQYILGAKSEKFLRNLI
jgi:thioredoxin 1